MPQVDPSNVSRPGTAESSSTTGTRAGNLDEQQTVGKELTEELQAPKFTGGEGESAIPEDRKVRDSYSLRT